MHYHLEVIMPPTDDVAAAIKQILEPFYENGKDEDGNRNEHSFYDFYVIGGRYSGVKIEASIDPDKSVAFHEELRKINVTVSIFQSGKPQLNPVNQIPMVDRLWREFFPDSPLKTCPFFSHFNDQYKDNPGFPDVMKLGDVPASLKASRVIITGPHCSGEKIEVAYMAQDSFWNGVTHIDSDWDGLVSTAIQRYQAKIENYSANYRKTIMITDDWLSLTVDYHT